VRDENEPRPSSWFVSSFSSLLPPRSLTPNQRLTYRLRPEGSSSPGRPLNNAGASDLTTTPPRRMNASSTEGWVKKGRRNNGVAGHGRTQRCVTKTNYDFRRSSFSQSLFALFPSLTSTPNARVTKRATPKTRRWHKERRHATTPTSRPMSPPSERVGYAVTRRSHPTTEWNANDDNSTNGARRHLRSCVRPINNTYSPSTTRTTYQDEDEAPR